MKTILAILVSMAGSTALASDVKVTSFRFLESGSHFSPAAELCGELVAPTGKPEMVKIVSDPNSKGSATYHVWTGKEGKFCSVLATYTGKAEADIE